MNKSKALDDFKSLIEILENNINLFMKGKTSTYRTVSVQLRMLMCDKDSLSQRLFPSAKLHRISSIANNSPELEMPALQLPIQLRFDGGKVIDCDLSVDDVLISIKEWLEQPLLTQHITVREFIESVCDKESKHSDPDFNDTLNFTKNIKFGRDESRKWLMIALGKYILNILKNTVEYNNL